MRRESFSPLRRTAFRGRSDAPASTVSGSEVRCADVPPIGIDAARADLWLGGGLRGDGLHEFYAAQKEDLSAALSFALLIALRQPHHMPLSPSGSEEYKTANSLQDRKAGLLWLRRKAEGVPYAPGLAQMGMDPEAITILHLADERAMLRAALDAVRAGAVGCVMLESPGVQKLLDLTATRRLVLAAAQTGTLVLIVRGNDKPGLSAAHSRWTVCSAPSRPLAAGAPGLPVFDLTLLRQRGGREGLHILLEWDRDTGCFREWEDSKAVSAPLSGHFSSMVADRKRADP